MSKEFVRSDSVRHLKLGKRKSKLRKWRKAKGRDNKIRLKRFGYPVSPTVGHRSSRKEAGKIAGMIPVLVHRPSDLKKLEKNSAAIISSTVGAKKKLEMIKEATELKVSLLNVKTGGKK
jgi:large subunit ribosomal protein L32e